MAAIETGVDRLVKIVQREKKVSVEAAAKELGVSQTVVQEWSDFLEQEGLVEITYSLSKAFLVEKHLSKDDVEKKGKEYNTKKEAFTRKVDATLKQLEAETADFETIKQQYYALKDQIGDQIDAVKDEIEQLHHYEELKKSIDHDILKQKVDYQKTLDEVHTRVSAEEKRYQKIIEEIGVENARLKGETTEFSDIRREQDDLAKRIEALQEILRGITGRLGSQEQYVKTHEERLLRLRDLAEKLQKEMKEKKVREIDPLLKISKDQEGRILRIQDEIVTKIKGQRDTLQTVHGQAEEVAKRFEHFFERRAKTEETLKQLEHAKAEMKEELAGLVRKAKAFDIAAKGADTNAHVKELEGKFKEFEVKRTTFADSLEKLKKIIMGKDDPAPTKQATTAQTSAPAPAKPATAPAKPTARAPAEKKTIPVKKKT
jgi:chromosome segregation ATPase